MVCWEISMKFKVKSAGRIRIFICSTRFVLKTVWSLRWNLQGWNPCLYREYMFRGEISINFKVKLESWNPWICTCSRWSCPRTIRGEISVKFVDLSTYDRKGSQCALYLIAQLRAHCSGSLRHCASEIQSKQLYMIGGLRYSTEYFTKTTSASIIVGGNRDVPGRNLLPTAGCWKIFPRSKRKQHELDLWWCLWN